MKRLVPLLLIALLAAPAAHAQFGGGGRGGGGRGGRGGQPPASSDSKPSDDAPRPKSKPADKIEIVGVITAIEPATDRVTIAYEAVEALNLPQGTRPFVVSKSALLKDRAVGDKVRFTLESQQVATLRPYVQGEDAALDTDSGASRLLILPPAGPR
jgi:Cu/Ag efflux protein CusF